MEQDTTTNEFTTHTEAAVTSDCVFWDGLGIVADFSGIISLFIGLLTLSVSTTVRNSLRRKDEIEEFKRNTPTSLKEIMDIIENANCDTPITPRDLENINIKLDAIKTSYERIIPLYIKIKILNCIRYADKKLINKTELSPEKTYIYKRKVQDICIRLKKEGRIL